MLCCFTSKLRWWIFRCQAARWTKSNKDIHKINFHPILLAAAYLSFARIVVNFHPGKCHYFCKPKQLVGHLRVKPLPPGFLQNGTNSSGPTEGGRGLTLECGMSPSPYQHFRCVPRVRPVCVDSKGGVVHSGLLPRLDRGGAGPEASRACPGCTVPV